MTPAGDAIELAVYSCFEDTLLFVPALCRPPREADALFGPLWRIGTVAAVADDGAWDPILAQIDRHLFATVPRQEGELLVGNGLVAAPAHHREDA